MLPNLLKQFIGYLQHTLIPNTSSSRKSKFPKKFTK